MARNILQILLSVSLGIICTASNGDTEATPSLEVEGPTTVDLGAFPANQEKKLKFTLKNSGTAPLEILKVLNACGCSKIELSSKRVEPGSQFSLSFTIGEKGKLSGHFEKSIYLQTNIPADNYFQLKITGEAIPLFKVSPASMLYLGGLEEAKARIVKFQIEPSSATPPDTSLGTPSVDSNHPVKVGIVKNDSGKGFILAMVITPAKEPASFQCTVRTPVLSPKGWPPLEILVSGYLKVPSETQTADK